MGFELEQKPTEYILEEESRKQFEQIKSNKKLNKLLRAAFFSSSFLPDGSKVPIDGPFKLRSDFDFIMSTLEEWANDIDKGDAYKNGMIIIRQHFEPVPLKVDIKVWRNEKKSTFPRVHIEYEGEKYDFVYHFDRPGESGTGFGKLDE